MKKAHSIRSGPYQSECGNVFGLQAFLALDDGEFHLLSLGQGAVSLATNGTVVDKHISAALTLNEAIALGIVEPLHGAHFTSSHLYHISNFAIFISSAALYSIGTACARRAGYSAPHRDHHSGRNARAV